MNSVSRNLTLKLIYTLVKHHLTSGLYITFTSQKTKQKENKTNSEIYSTCLRRRCNGEECVVNRVLLGNVWFLSLKSQTLSQVIKVL